MLEFLKRQYAAALEARSALKADLDGVLAAPTAEKRDLSEAESALFTEKRAAVIAKDAELDALKARVADAEADEARDASVRAELAKAGIAPAAGEERSNRPVGGGRVTDPEIYARGNWSQSYFRDLSKSQSFGDRDAADRLHRYAEQTRETRALGNTNTTGGSGGEFAPPEWIIEDFVALIRPYNATGQLYKQADIPDGISSINLPRVTSGTTVALQSTQNTALSQTDMTTASVGTGFSTVGGKAVVAQQLLDQSGIPFDQVVTADLAAAYGLTKGTQVLLGTGTGTNNNSVVNGLVNATGAQSTVWTQASPTITGFFGQCASMLSKFALARYAEPTVWVMNPRRWYWLLGATDSSGRPLVVPDAILADNSIRATNPIASNLGDPVQVVGAVGMFLGLPVVIDPLIPTNLGAGTNQDEVFLLKQDDLWLFSSAPKAETFTQPYADTLGVLFRLYGYVGAILNRQPLSIATLTGTGLVPPPFAS